MFSWNKKEPEPGIECLACGFLTIGKRGIFEICPVCFWEDEGEIADPDEPLSGANGDLSLNEARENYRRFGATSEDLKVHVREPLPDECVSSFSDEMAQLAITKIRKTDTPVVDGLSQDEIDQIESLLGAVIPPDLKTLFRVGMPVSNNNNNPELFPDWHNNFPKLIKDMQTDVERAFTHDIEKCGYWHSSFGKKPSSIGEAKKQAIKVIRSWPPLIRVYGHRFMPTSPSGAGNPVLSVWQATDSIYYGNDLADYLRHEFEITLPIKIPESPRDVPFWGDAFDLKNEQP
jgi:hypothetical protein